MSDVLEIYGDEGPKGPRCRIVRTGDGDFSIVVIGRDGVGSDEVRVCPPTTGGGPDLEGWWRLVSLWRAEIPDDYRAQPVQAATMGRFETRYPMAPSCERCVQKVGTCFPGPCQRYHPNPEEGT